MKNISNKQAILSFLIILMLGNIPAYSHFGQRGPFGGSVNCMIVNDSMVYVGTENGGVFESVNSQITAWRARPVGLKSGKINALAHTGTYLFAATADSGIFRFTGFAGSDRYWEKMNNGLSQLRVKSLIPVDSITVLAGTDGDGLFKTTDKGANWSPVNSILLNGTKVTSLVKSSGRIFLALESQGVFISDDEGDTWSDFNDMNTQGMAGTNVLSYNSQTDELLVVNHMGTFIAGTAGSAVTPSYVTSVSGLPVSANIRNVTNDGMNWYLASDSGVYVSPSGAVNWTVQNDGFMRPDAGAIIPFQNALIAGTRGDGLFKSPSGSVSWTAVNTNFNNLRINSMITRNVSEIVAATEKGIFVSTDLAASYTPANTGITDSMYVTDVCYFGNTLVATTLNQGVFVSQDTGRNWTAFNTNLMQLNISKVYSSGNFVYIIDAPGDIFQSDLVSGWTMIQSGLPFAAQPTSLGFYANNLILGTEGDGVFIRVESGGSWTQVNNGLTDLNVMAVTANGTNLFAGTRNNGVFTADISTLSWSPTATINIPHIAMIGLDPSRIQAMAYYQGYVYASYKGGLVATSDNGANWIEAGNQFNLPSYTNVRKISHVTSRIFVTTDFNSLYSQSLSELPTVGIDELSSNAENENLYLTPNPASGILQVGLKDISRKMESLRILDSRGKVVRDFTLVNSPVQTIGIEDLSAGVYFVQVNSGKEVHLRKLVIE